MGWKLVLYLFVGLCTAASINNNNGWRQGYQYVYKVHGQSLSNYDDDYYKGMVMKADLIVKPESDEVLIGQISGASYARYEGEDAPICGNVDSQPQALQFKPLDLGDKPFRIRMKQGVIKSIEVHGDLQHWQANIIKSIVGQTQLDIQGVNLMKDRINQLPQNGSYSGVYKTMEDWVTGKFATLYELSEVPKTEIQYKPWLVPFPQLQGDGTIMEVVKTIDYSKSKERVMYNYGLATDEETDLHNTWMGNFLNRITSQEAFISGRPDQYTIQSSVTFDVITAAPLHNNKEKFSVESCHNITLTKYESSTSQFDLPSPLKSLGSLTYSYNEETGKDKNGCEDSSSSSSSSSSSQDSNCATRKQQNKKHHKSQSSSSSSSSDSSFSSDFSSMSDESDWKDDQPKLSEAPQSGLLPLTMGYMGLHSHKNVDPAQVVQKLTNEIAQGIMNPKTGPQTLTRFVILTSLIRTMDVEQLQKVTSMLYSNEQGTLKTYAWNSLRDALAEAGTGPALLVLIGLINENKIPAQMAGFIFDQITHSSRQPTEDYIRTLFTFTKSPKIEEQPEFRTIIPIAFASLVRKVYVNKVASHDQFPVHSYGRYYTKRGMTFVTDEYIPYLQQRLEEAILQEDSLKAQTYISTLGAIGHRHILRVFKPYFSGEKYATPFQRLQMVLSLRDLAKFDRKHAQPVLYKIYQNHAEQEDVRVASVYMLMKTMPPAYMLQKMAAYINVDQSEEVNSAVESIIRSLAELEDPEFEEIRQNAQSALYLLNGKSYSKQYSRKYIENNYLPESNSGFMEILGTIVGEDSSVPKAMHYSLRTNINGVKSEDLRIEFMVNSFDQLSDALFRQTATFRHQQRQQDQHASKANQNQWSPENIARKLKMRRERPYELDGRISFEIAGLRKRYSFNDETIDLLTKVIAEIEQELKGKKTLQFTKFINNDDMAVSTPTIMGIPCIYTFDEPTLVHFEGHITATAEPKVSDGDSLHLPKNVKASGEIKAFISKKRQGQLGFVVPFTGEHFLVGYEKNMQVQIPLNLEVVGDISKNQYTIQMSMLDPQQEYNLLSFSTLPYVAERSVVSFTPVVEDPKTQIMKEEAPKTYVNEVIGEDTGVALRVMLYSEEKLNWAWFFEQVNRYEDIPLLMASWYDESVSYSQLSVTYEGKRSVNNHIQVHIGYYESDGQENCRNNGDVDIGQLYKTPTDRQTRQKQFYQKACSSIANAEVKVLDAEVHFNGKQDITFSATAAVATSNVDPKSNILFYATRQPSHPRVEPYQVALFVKSHIPKVNGLNPLFALKNSLKGSIQGQLGFGKDEQSSAKINMHATLEKTNDYKQYLANHPLMRQCAQETKQGNYLLDGCSNLILKANLMDHVTVKLQHEKLGKHALNNTRWLSNAFSHYLGKHYQENSVNATGNNANQINIDVDFHDDFEQVDLEIQTEHRDMLFKDVEIVDLVQPIISIHPMWSDEEDLLGPLSSDSEQSNPSCGIDKTYANTFDNFTYPIHIGNEWTVALLYSPSSANYPYYQKQGQRGQPQKSSPKYRDGYQQHQSRQQGQHNPQHGQKSQNQQEQGHQQQRYQQQGHHQQQGRDYGHQQHGHHFQQEQVEHNQPQQVEQYAVLVRNKQNSRDYKEVKIVIRSPETNHQLMEIDMLPSERSEYRAEVYVNQKKQQIQQERSSDYGGSIQIHSVPNGEVVFTVLDVLQMWFDGERLRLDILDANKFQNDVRGLCGTFGNSWTDFTCPENCLVKSFEDFVQSYQPNRPSRPQGVNHECNFREVIYADVVSEQDVGQKSHDKESQKGSCTQHQTRYITQENGDVCFTSRPLPICKPSCKPKQRITKNVEVYCVSDAQKSAILMKEIKKGSNPNFSTYTPTKRVPMEVDQSCAKH